MSPIIGALCALAFTLFLGWYGGADFSERNGTNAYIVFVAVVMALATYSMIKLLRSRDE